MEELSSKPVIFDDGGLQFYWDNKKVWKLDIPTEDMPIEKLLWHLEIPVWRKHGSIEWDLTPMEVLNDPSKSSRYVRKISESDLSYPIDIMWHKGKWALLDGNHRLARSYQLGLKNVKVRKISKKYIPEISSKFWKDYKKGDK